jgi:DNA transformation protein
VDFAVEQFGALGEIQAKSMFGGVGFYCNGVFFAIYDRKHIYLKADASTMPSFHARGLPAFQPFEDRPGTMKYYRAPPEMFEDPESLREWAGGAIRVAAAAGRKAPGKRPAPRRSKSDPQK